MTVYCFDTDVLSAIMRCDQPLHLVRRLAATAPADQCTTAVTLGELVYGATRARSAKLARQIQTLVIEALSVVPFDTTAAEVYGTLRASLEESGRRLAEPDLRIASIALARELTLVTGNVRHFARIPDLSVEDWLRA